MPLDRMDVVFETPGGVQPGGHRCWCCALVLATGLAGAPGTAFADGYYAGFVVGLDYLEGDYRKSASFDGSRGAAAGFMEAEDRAGHRSFSAKVLFGHRWNWSSEHYFSLEADAALHGGGKVRGFLVGTGVGERDVWPGAWNIDRNRSAGLTAKFGYHPPALQEMLGAGSSLYLLGGLRWMDLDVEADFAGLPGGNAVEGTERSNEDVNPWSAGFGLEFGALQGRFNIELRYTEYDFDWSSGGGADLGDPYLGYDFDVEEWGLFFGYSLPLSGE